jgi:hypothetical protein
MPAQSQRPQPLSTTSILSFHDAVELFLVIAADHLKAPLPKRIEFMDYWTKLSSANCTSGVNLSGRFAMDRLNRRRNDFKHTGALPGTEAIEQARTDVTSLFADNTPLVFGADVDFTEFDMIDLVTQQPIQDKLRAAAGVANQDDLKEAISLIAEAFKELIDDYIQRKKVNYDRSVYGFGPKVSDPSIELVRLLGDHYTQLTKAVADMQRSMRVMALGLDYRH